MAAEPGWPALSFSSSLAGGSRSGAQNDHRAPRQLDLAHCHRRRDQSDRPVGAVPEGPVLPEGRLYYVEYGGHTVKTWDGLTITELWKSDGCGPSAVAPFGDGFLVACYDAGTMVRISAGGKTVQTIDKDDSGGSFLGPNDIAP